MEHSEVVDAPAGSEVPQELLEEMIWFFRVEDATPWNYSILALAMVVVMISMFLLRRSILANRNRKMQSQDKETPEAMHLDEAKTKEKDSLSNLREMLIPEEPTMAPVETEMNEKDIPLVFLPVFLPEPQETDS
ncbi:organic solute transporter subunit beta [Nannospalax galili]|uniref:Solute carrier family 51, beta subunit n=1 Tax=Nannospalax galili TaxID=1026970 RepID=A0A8C6R9E8_NANGA|nr:organic solute transporter subunit beta [Nannospalax galili]